MQGKATEHLLAGVKLDMPHDTVLQQEWECFTKNSSDVSTALTIESPSLIDNSKICLTLTFCISSPCTLQFFFKIILVIQIVLGKSIYMR
jgi:hypothetical protein